MTHRKKNWWILFVTTSATALVFLDQSIMPVALAEIQRSLGFDELGLSWVVNTYLLTLMSLLLIGGRLSDLLGKKKIYLIGLSLFGAASILGALSYSKATLLLARAVQGAGAALTLPTTAALLIHTFPPHQRARAIGINVGISAIFLTLGPILGGVLTQYFSWRMIFWVNIPIVLFSMSMSLLLIKVERIVKNESFHFLGALLVLLSVCGFVIALMQGNEWGWSSWPIVLFLLASPCLAFLFVILSLKEPFPLIDFHVFKEPRFSGATLAIFLTQMMIAVTIFWSIYFQNQLGYSPIKTGLTIFAATLPVLIAAPLAGVLADRFGAKLPMTIGYSLVIFGLAWVALTALRKSVTLLVPGLAGFGLGIPMIFSPAIALALSHVPADKLGASSGITNAARQLAATIGLALMTACFQAINEKTHSPEAAFTAVSFLAAFFAISGMLAVQLIIPKKGRLVDSTH